MERRHFIRTLAAALAGCGLIGAAHAQTVAELAAYDKPDREQKLLAGAKKEGELQIYTSAQSDDMGALVKGFEAKYPGITVNMWRSSSETVLQRFIAEGRAGRNTMDVAETNGPELEAMHREKLTEKMSTP